MLWRTALATACFLALALGCEPGEETKKIRERYKKEAEERNAPSKELGERLKAYRIAARKCAGAVHDAVKKATPDGLAPPLSKAPEDAGKLKGAVPFVMTGGVTKAERIDEASNVWRYLDKTPLIDHASKRCVKPSKELERLTEPFSNREAVAKALEQVRAEPAATPPEVVMAYALKCAGKPLSEYTGKGGYGVVNHYTCEVALAWVSTKDGTLLAAASGTGTGAGKQPAVSTTKEIEAADGEGRDKATKQAFDKAKETIAGWK